MTAFAIDNIIASPEDQRDYIFVPKYTPENLIDKSDYRDRSSGIENQGQIGSCVSNMLTSDCEFVSKSHGLPIQLSRLAHYNMTKAFSGRLGQEGLYMRNAYKVAYKYGLALEENYPYDVSKDNIDPPQEIYQLALERRVERYERIQTKDQEPQTIVNHIIAALQEGLTVGVAFSVTKSIYDLKGPWEGQEYKKYSQQDNPFIGGHAMQIVGHDTARGKFILANSWGETWGDQGFGGFPFSIVEEPWFEAWIVRTFDGMGIPEVPGIKLEYMNKFRMHARIVPKPEELGKTVKVWVGGTYQDQIYFKQPVTNRDYFLGNLSDFSGGTDAWVPMAQSGMKPVIDDYIIKDDNPLRIFSWTDLSPYAGADIYVAYGDTLETATIQKICTLPQTVL